MSVTNVRGVKISFLADDDALKAKLREDQLKTDKLRESLGNMSIKAEDKDAAYKIRSLEMSTDRLKEKMGSARLTVAGYEKASLQLLKLDAQADRLNKTIHVKVDESTRGGLLSGGGGVAGAGSGALDALPGVLSNPVVASAAAAAAVAILPAIAGGTLGLGIPAAGFMLGKQGLSTINADKAAVASAQTSIKGVKTPSPSQLLALSKAQKQLNTDTRGWAGEMARVGREFQPIVKQVMGFVHSLGGPLAKLFSAGIPGIKAFITAIEPAVKTILPLLTKSLRQNAPAMAILGKAFGDLLVDGTKLFVGLSRGFRASAIVVKAAVDTIGGLIVYVGDQIGNVVRFVGDILTGHWKDAWSTALDFVRNFKNMAGTILDGLPGMLLRIGEDAMQGLLHGLESAGSSVLSYVGNFVKSIPGKFMSLLGIHSPSTVMHEIGMNTGRGLANGIHDATPLVIGASGKMAKSVIDAHKKMLAELKQANTFRKGVKGSILGGFDITGVTNSAGGAPDAGDVMQSLKLDLGQVKSFASNIKKLSHMGLNRKLLRQIINAGPVSGGPVAAALADASRGKYPQHQP